MEVVTKKEKVLNVWKFIVVNGSCSLFQVIVLFILSTLLFFVGYFSGLLIWIITGKPQLASEIAPIISCGIVFGTYALIWFVYWSMLFNSGTKWFYWRVAFSTIPFIVLLILFKPQPNPMAMIQIPTEFNFSCFITGVILFPIYSVSVYKFVLQRSSRKIRNMIVVCSIILILGSVIFITSWKMMNEIYRMIGV